MSYPTPFPLLNKQPAPPSARAEIQRPKLSLCKAAPAVRQSVTSIYAPANSSDFTEFKQDSRRNGNSDPVSKATTDSDFDLGSDWDADSESEYRATKARRHGHKKRHAFRQSAINSTPSSGRNGDGDSDATISNPDPSSLRRTKKRKPPFRFVNSALKVEVPDRQKPAAAYARPSRRPRFIRRHWRESEEDGADEGGTESAGVVGARELDVGVTQAVEAVAEGDAVGNHLKDNRNF